MSTEIKVPALPESVADATVQKWRKQVGDSVKRDEILVELETDKVVLEVPAPADGVLSEISAAEGSVVTADSVLGQMGDAAQNEAGGSAAEAPSAAPAVTARTEAETHPAPDQNTSSGESMTLEVPALPESVADATVAAWHKQPGDSVAQGDNLVDLETDKVMLEVQAPSDGVLDEILQQEGATVTQGQALGTISTGAANAGSSASATAPRSEDDTGPGTVQNEDTGPAQTSPSSRAALSAAGLSRDDVQGSGKNNRILREDVEKAASSAPAPTPSKPAPAAASAPEAPAGERSEQRVPMTRLRARIAERLMEAKQGTAMLTTFNEINMHPVMSLRNRYKEQFEKTHGIKLGFMSFFVKAATEALKRFPDINASIDGKDIVYHGYCDVGIAVSSDRGLVVPILRDAEQMSLAQIELQIAEYAKQARDGKLGVDAMQGGTFTITNGGVFGSLLSTPILNPPQSAILGMHATQERPVAENGQVVIRPMMYIALSYDHRIVDGKGAVTFLKTIKELVEDPARILMEL